ncbi:MAG: hypothetical protein J7494_00625 [Sphingobium sp.]|nr:hypothetical protein [Sphingobium sp.]
MTAKEPFEVNADLDQRCLYITMRGIWTAAIFEDFTKALMTAEVDMQRLEGTSYTLVDGTEFPLQDMAIVERFVPLTIALAIPETRRTALVVPQPLERTQTRAAAEIVNARHFRTIESARDWLFSDEA